MIDVENKVSAPQLPNEQSHSSTGVRCLAELSDEEILSLLQDGSSDVQLEAPPPDGMANAPDNANDQGERFWEQVARLQDEVNVNSSEQHTLTDTIGLLGLSLSLLAAPKPITNAGTQHKSTPEEQARAQAQACVALSAAGPKPKVSLGESGLLAMRAQTAQKAFAATLAALGMRNSALQAAHHQRG